MPYVWAFVTFCALVWLADTLIGRVLTVAVLVAVVVLALAAKVVRTLERRR